MKNAQLKDSLLAQGDEAFLALTQQIQHMLDLIDFFMSRYKVTSDAKDGGLALQHEELKQMINTLGSVPYQLAEVIRRWKHNEPRVFSKIGVELSLLNEIWATLEATMLFFITRDIDLEPYNRQKALRAYTELCRVNKLLD